MGSIEKRVYPTPAESEGWLAIPLAVEAAQDGFRLDRFLHTRIRRLSRTRIQQIIAAGHVRKKSGVGPAPGASGGASLRPASRVRAGELVIVVRPAPPEPPAAGSFEVLHHDDALLVLDKPAHLPVHPSARYHKSTLTALMRGRFGADHGWEMAHRLDRETSGVMVFGQRGKSGGVLKRAFQERRVHKEYLALVHGVLEARATIDAPIGPAVGSRVRIKMGTGEGGRPATTEVVPLSYGEFRGEPITLVRALPHTGRQHQIRVHLAHLGHAVLGDKLYGIDEACFLAFADHEVLMDDLARALGLARHALHANRIAFAHPQTGAPVEITAPWPADLATILPHP